MTGRGDLAGGAAAEPADTALLDGALAETVRRTGATGGAVYLWEQPGRSLALAVLCGIPVEVARPWQRIPLDDPTPVADAVREDRLVWVGSQADLAHVYPRTAVPLPYRFALVAVPLPGRRGPKGALLLLWPASHPADATRRELEHITAEARRLARTWDEAGADAVSAAPARPRVVPPARPHPYGGHGPQPAADWAERLPEGALALDLEGRIVFVDGTAAELLGRSAAQLVGTRPWQSLPWLDVPLVEDRYRTAVISRDPVEFTARKPPDGRLRFELYPDASGISIRITDPGGATTPAARAVTAGTVETTRTAETAGTVAGTAGTEQPLPAPGPPRQAPAGPGGADAGRVYQLLHLSAALTETVAVRDVVELVAHQILPAFGADALVLSAADSGRLKITGHHGYDRAVIDRLDALPLDTALTPAGQVLATGAPAFFGSPQELADAYPRAPWISGKQAWAFLPLMISARPVGCCILSYDRPHAFTADERAVLTSLAGLIAQALDRARLYDTAHDLAHGLQQALLPHRLPTVPGLEIAGRYLPAGRGMEIGGDFYDVIVLDTTTTVAAVIGDVQGHNVAAAALMGQLRTAVRATAGAPPDEVLTRTARLLEGLDTDLLASCLYAHIDLAAGLATLGSAGHPPPLVHVPGEPPRRVELDPAPLLGVGADEPCPVTRLELPPGTLLAFYTDGLVEKPTAAGVDADRGTDLLASVLAEHTGCGLDDLVEAVLGASGPAARNTDDIALLLLRTRAAAGGTAGAASAAGLSGGIAGRRREPSDRPGWR
ncbi:SpoIIE family protein phosphatase [Streptomyces sp. NPDC085524]|uniref:SpoIIE family protein phosphatase n=1 Tax=Streptomyces sp. NPDC085524 TaxID=3365728 RepID=UPI0037CE9941